MPLTAPTTAPSRRHTATIALGASLSDVVTINPTHTLYAIVMPSAWDTADLSFQGSVDGSTYGDIYSDAGDEVLVPIVAGAIVYISSSDLRAFPYLKVRSGTSGTPVNQTAQRLITLISHP